MWRLFYFTNRLPTKSTLIQGKKNRRKKDETLDISSDTKLLTKNELLRRKNGKERGKVEAIKDRACVYVCMCARTIDDIEMNSARH